MTLRYAIRKAMNLIVQYKNKKEKNKLVYDKATKTIVAVTPRGKQTNVLTISNEDADMI